MREPRVLSESTDIIVIGGGIAGASVAYELAGHAGVTLLERESQPGYHSTGRSAAHFLEGYGPPVVRRLVQCSTAFMRTPPQDFAEHPLLQPRATLVVSPPGEESRFHAELDAARTLSPSLREIAPEEACAIVPVLRRERIGNVMLEPDSAAIDVHGLLHGFLRGARSRGARIVVDAEVRAIQRAGGRWTVDTPAGRFSADILVNAAGAWADAVAALAGVAPIGLVAKRRTAFIFEPPPGLDVTGWPLSVDLAETWYFRPESGQLLGSPADATPVPAQDVQPEELDVAIAVDRIESMTTMRIRRIGRRWAGLRSFVADGDPVNGMDPEAEGFFWLAGQGGYGIETASAMARAAAALIATGKLPDDFEAAGIEAEALGITRLRHHAAA
jgi:D-arginine dehydrogenase